MAEYFMGQVMMAGFGFAQRGFAQCNGGSMSVSQNAALFTLLGISYGGDGVTTFRLPDLRGRTPVGGGFPSLDAGWPATPYPLGGIGGVESVSLTGDQNGAHMHAVTATSDSGTINAPDGSQIFASTGNATVYGPASALLPLAGGPTSTAGAGAPHENMQPFEVINFNIALTGIYPSRG